MFKDFDPTKIQDVNSDFMGMTAMLAMAEQYDSNHRLKDYLKALPEDDSYRLMFEALDDIGRKDRDKVKNVASTLVANESRRDMSSMVPCR